MDKQSFIAYYGKDDLIIGAASMGRQPAPMIIGQAMQVNVMPTMSELKSGKVTIDDIKKRVVEKKGKSACKRTQCECKPAQHAK